jgi:hypothetical protein
MIKTNIPSRIAFAVASQTDSRIILDQGGAESLLGMGDMLFSPMGSSKLLRVQGALVTNAEMKLVTEHWRRQAKPDYHEELLENPAGPDADQQGQAAGGDELLGEAIKTVVNTGAASVALLQRRLRVGYARAGRLIDIMEEMGIISGYDGSKARSVLIDEAGLPAVAAGDVHMHVRARRALQDTLTAIRRNQPLAECGFALFPNGERHLRSRARLATIYPPALLAETLAVADRCAFSLDELRYEYPEEIVPPGETPASHLRKLVEEGLRRRYGRASPHPESSAESERRRRAAAISPSTRSPTSGLERRWRRPSTAARRWTCGRCASS